MAVTSHQRCRKSQPCPVCGDEDQHCFFSSDGTAVICTSRQAVPLGKPIKSGFGTLVRLHDKPDKPVVLPPREVETPLIDPELKSKMYQTLFSVMRLSVAHRDHLTQERGFDETWIKRKMYRSVPDRDQWEARRMIAESMTQKWDIETLSHLPGILYGNGKRPAMGGYPGILIPVTSPDGSTRGCQIRNMNGRGPRYTWLSSPQAKSGSPLHTARSDKVNSLYLYLTEGPLKADYIAFHTGSTCLASAGVSNWGPSLEEDLKAVLSQGRAKVVIANDAGDYGQERNGDYNPVTRCTYRLAHRLVEYRPYILVWEGYKGYDDYLREDGDGAKLLSFPEWVMWVSRRKYGDPEILQAK